MSVLLVLVLLAVEIVSQRDFENKQLLNSKFIYPGTKWCGSADIAENNDDLGTEVETDKCCRIHDHCKDIIIGFQTKHNLTNFSSHARYDCACDATFRDCLLNVGALSSDIIGTLYFNLLGTKCFREDYPKIRCIYPNILSIPKCLEYEYDTSKPKQYQWFDVPNY